MSLESLRKDEGGPPPTADEWNEMLREIDRRRLIGKLPEEPGWRPDYHWRTTVRREGLHRWKVFVSPGTVNDRVAGITYRRRNDPRGWVMPETHSRRAEFAALFGANFQFIDRRLTERKDPPYLVVTTPTGSDTATGFVPVAATARPRALRSAADWERDLYRASVFVSAQAFQVDPAFPFLPPNFPQDAPERVRVYAGRLPAGIVDGVALELARLWLLRVPGDPSRDQIRVQQMVYWSLEARELGPYLDFGFQPSDLPSFGLGFGLIDAVGGLSALISQLAEIGINETLAGLEKMRWWTV